MPDYIKNAVLEGLRVVVLAIIPVILAGINSETGEIAFNWQVILAVGLVALLRFVDKLIHEWGKANEIEGAVKGITRF